MKIKHFTDSDMDGISCGLLSELVLEDCEITGAGPESISDKVERLLNAEQRRKIFDKIIITDLSITPELAERIEKTDKYRVRLYDHHKSAEWLNKYDWATVSVEDETGRLYSATEIYWNEFISKMAGKGLMGRSANSRKVQLAEEFVSLVTRYDTWAWDQEKDIMPKFLNHLLSIYGPDQFKENIRTAILEKPVLLTDGDVTMARAEETRQNKYLRKKIEDVIEMEVMGHSFGVVFAEQYKSELGNRMCEEYDIDVAAIVDIGGNSVSYRTAREDIDLSEIAGHFGGGGHAKAAGSSFSEDFSMELLGKIFQIES